MPRHVDVEARRTQVVDAVWRLAAREGLDAVSARAVAAEAGLSLGAITRLHPQQDQLHVEAMVALVGRVQRRLDAVPVTGDALEDAVARLVQSLPLDAESHTEAVVFYAFVSRARTTPALQQVADQVDAALARLCRDAVVAVRPDLEADDELTGLTGELHALTEGLAFALVTWPASRDAERARSTVRTWLERISRPG